MAARTRAAIRRVFSAEMQASTFDIARAIPGAFLDYLQVDPSGIIRLIGWSTAGFAEGKLPAVLLDGEAIPFLQSFRFRRPDVLSESTSLLNQTGLEFNYLVPESRTHQRVKTLTLQLAPDVALHYQLDSQFVNPDYRSLFDSPEVLHRDQIYGSGPPNSKVHPHVAELAKQLRGPVLDFGCGQGALLDEFQTAGIEAHGLELDSPMIRAFVPAEKLQSITLYDGSFPAPFADRSFESVVCSEVLEHIPDYRTALAEIARIAIRKVLITVPDATAIPLGFRHGSVPWHLLESTHVNFFNQESLASALKPHFSHIEFGRLGSRAFNDTPYYVTLTAMCLK